MAVSVPSRTPLLPGVLGLFAFCAAQIPLLLVTPTVAGGMKSPGWFLNSGYNVLLVGSILAGGAAIVCLRRLASVRDAVVYGAGAVTAMIVTLSVIGPGTIFPIVIAFGMGVIALVVGVGATCGAAVRALRTHAGYGGCTRVHEFSNGVCRAALFDTADADR